MSVPLWLRRSKTDGGRGFRAAGQCVATATVGEVDDIAAVLGFDGRLIDFIRRAFFEIEGDVLHVFLS